MKLFVATIVLVLATNSYGQGCMIPPKHKKVAKITPTKPTIVEKKATNTEENAVSSENKNTQTVNVRVGVPDRIIDRLRVQTIYKYKRNPNHLLLLVGQSKTKAEVKQDDCCHFSVDRKRETDFGLQYVRDFGNVSGSVMGTANDSFYVGFGVNF